MGTTIVAVIEYWNWQIKLRHKIERLYNEYMMRMKLKIHASKVYTNANSR